MNHLTSRPCLYSTDYEVLTTLWMACRVAADVRLYPTIWRLRLLLTSRVWDAAQDARVWVGADGQMVGFAMLWRRRPTSPYLVLDGFAHPAFEGDVLCEEIVLWGDRRAQEVARAQGTALTVSAAGLSRTTEGERALQRMGYTLLLPDPAEHNVYFARSLLEELPSPTLPPGFIIRGLQNSDDLSSYQALHGFASVNPLHLQEQLASDEYCHLVVFNPDGGFVAYCECSICTAEWQLTGQCLGWIDYIETRPEQQKQGLGRTVLLAGLKQLQDWGAQTALLVTLSSNAPAINLYQRCGFTEVALIEPVSYQKIVTPA
jgi:ribosomal protein S18 acetylase RimI-like enzyme